MVFAHTVGEHLFDISHHMIIFGLGVVAGIAFGVRQIIVKKKEK